MRNLTYNIATITAIIVLYGIAKGHILITLATGRKPTASCHVVLYDAVYCSASLTLEDSFLPDYLST
jgi:hypothetical protein